jgi:hypothetical protein
MTAISQLHGPALDAAASEETPSVANEHSAGSAYACPVCRTLEPAVKDLTLRRRHR